jgi:hypothetical protein
MKTLFVIAAVLSLPCMSLAGDPPREWKELKAGGETYLDVRVSKSEPDGLRIIHKNGVAKVLFSDLPEDVRKAYNHDPGRAAEYADLMRQAEEVKAQAAEIKELERTRDTLRNHLTAEQERQLKQMETMVKMDAHQLSRMGLLGTIETAHFSGTVEKAGSMQDHAVWTWANPVNAVLSGSSAQQATAVGDDFFWKGKAWRIGTISYTTVMGAERTVAHYTTDRSAALAWLKNRK